MLSDKERNAIVAACEEASLGLIDADTTMWRQLHPALCPGFLFTKLTEENCRSCRAEKEIKMPPVDVDGHRYWVGQCSVCGEIVYAPLL